MFFSYKKYRIQYIASITIVALVFNFFSYIPQANAVSVTWIGGSNGTWDTASNWNTGSVPTKADDVVIVNPNTALTVTVPLERTVDFRSLTLGGGASKNVTLILAGSLGTTAHLTIAPKGTLIQANNLPQTLTGTLTIENTGLLTHKANSSSVTSTVNFVVGSLNIATGGKVDANAKGYLGGKSGSSGSNGYGPGAGNSVDLVGNGAGYGGPGSQSTLSNRGKAGLPYGSTTTPELQGGSGGGGSAYSIGGNGGGVIKIIAKGPAVIDGAVSADGGNGLGTCGTSPTAPTGAGSGGGVRMEATTLSGKGFITAKGGVGGNNGSGCAGGNGGGGRILVVADASAFVGSTGVVGGSNTANGSKPGGVGSVKIEAPTPTETQTLAQPETQTESADIPGVVGLFFRDVGQKLQLVFTIDPVKDASKRIEFADNNLQLAQTITAATQDSKIQSRALGLVERAKELITVVNEQEDRWSKGEPDAVNSLIAKTQTYFETAKILVASISETVNLEYQAGFKKITDDLNAQNIALAAFIKEKYPVITVPPGVSDKDRDGIPDDGEIELGTKPADFDTDGDGLSDRAEIEKHGTDPLEADTDGDGFRDGLEILKGFNPLGSGLLQVQQPPTSQLKYLMTIQTIPTLSSTTLQYITNALKNYEIKK